MLLHIKKLSTKSKDFKPVKASAKRVIFSEEQYSLAGIVPRLQLILLLIAAKRSREFPGRMIWPLTHRHQF
jgi:hypothetical protein